ncbi:hypothetical protein KY289_033188, partial [Solanum tuberosum]
IEEDLAVLLKLLCLYCCYQEEKKFHQIEETSNLPSPDRHNSVTMEIEAVIPSEHRQLLHTINVSEVTDQHALHSSPNQLQVVLVMQEDEDVEMTVINNDDIIPLHNSNELDK